VFLRAQANAMSQTVFNAPSVFNFYPPDYVVRHHDSRAGVRAAKHDHGIRTDQLRELAGVFHDQSGSTVYGATGTQLDWSALTALAANPSALVDKLNRLLLHGTMSTAAQSAVVTAVNAVSATDALGRAKAAFYLVATSSQYQVER
jgi:hypothetical protein